LIGQAAQAFELWRSVPPPVRGNLVREFGNLLREHKEPLGTLVSIEAGKIRSEGLGEVQEMIDICDLAVGQSRQLVGATSACERPVALVSATGSTAMGRVVAPRVAARLGRYLLELGGNNAAIVAPSADLDLAVRGIVFSAAGTAGQRCTTLRRVIAHASIAEEL